MRHHLCQRLALTALLLGALLTAVHAQTDAPAPATTRAATEPSNTRMAKRVLHIRAGLKDDYNIQSVLDASIARIRTRLDVDASYRFNLGEFEDNYQKCTLTVFISDAGQPAIAKEFADAVAAEMPLVAADRKAREAKRVAGAADAQWNEAAQAFERLRAKRQKLVDEIREGTGRADFSSQGIQSAAQKAEEERQRLELDVLGKTARRKAIEDELAVQTRRAEDKVKEDPIAAELKKIVEAREGRVERSQQLHKQGLTSEEEISSAIADAADARAKLLLRQHDAANEAGGDLIDSLTRELTTLSIDLRELQARLEFIQERLPALGRAIDLVDQIGQLEPQMATAREQANAFMEIKRDTDVRYATLKPFEVEVMKSTDRAEVEEKELKY